jgi:S1-C subfamily serine protease
MSLKPGNTDMNGIVIRLAGVEQPETRVFHQERVTIGTSPTCDLSFRWEEDNLPSAAELLELRLVSGTYRIASFNEEAHIIRDGEAIAVGEAIRDGDTLHFGTTGVRLRFFTLSPSMELVESLQLGTAVLEKARSAESAVAARNGRRLSGPRTDVALVFVKQLLRELAAEIPRRKLYLTLGLVLLLTGLLVYINILSFLVGRSNSASIAELNESVRQLREQVSETGKEMQKTRQDVLFLTRSVSFAAQVVENYGPGVCLIYGTYSYADPRSGREARFKEPTETNNPLNPNGSLNLSLNGNGPVYELEFIGTGFLAGRGRVLTNRHVVEPWVDDPVASLIQNQGLKPKRKEMYAYFPKIPRPFTLTLLEVGRRADVALCSFEQGDLVLPILPLDEEGEGAVSGQSVALIGYPAGIEGLLAKVEDTATLGIITSGRPSLRTVLNELASRTLIQPLTTQGHISDLAPSRIVHDALTSEGGSGGPIFGSNGKVVGINFAMLPGSPANFGVPIRYGIELLKKHQPANETELSHNASDSSAARNTVHP